MENESFNTLSRRGFLRLTGAAAGIAAWGALSDKLQPEGRLQATPLNMQRLIVINMSGGNDTTNMVIPKTISEYQSRRVGIAVPAGTELSLAGGPGNALYGLHP